MAETAMRKEKIEMTVVTRALHRVRFGLVAAALAAVVWLLAAAPALAATAGPAWSITSVTQPTIFVSGDSSGVARFLIRATNTGSTPLDPEATVTITDELPTGVTLLGEPGLFAKTATTACSGTTTITCTAKLVPQGGSAGAETKMAPGVSMSMIVPVSVEASAGTVLTNVVSVEGGGAATGAQAEVEFQVGSTGALAPFGIQAFDVENTDIDGSAVTQAGSHPFASSTSIYFNSQVDPVFSLSMPPEDARDIEVHLPPGFVGNPTAVPTCTQQQLNAGICPANTQVGVVTFNSPASGIETSLAPFYNMVPNPGVAAQFGFVELGTVVQMVGRVEADPEANGGYVAAVEFPRLTETLPLIATSLSLWGVPADGLHSSARLNPLPVPEPWITPSTVPPVPFLTLPSDCSAGPVATKARINSWQNPTTYRHASSVSHLTDGTPAAMTGCDRVPFDPALVTKPAVGAAGAPSGFNVDLHLPQTQDPGGIAEAYLKKAVVTLPEGVTVNPPSANGLEGCSLAQIGLGADGPGTCPAASKVGSVEIETPLLDHPLPGAVFVARQGENPFNSLLALYVVIDDAETGVTLKLPGRVEPDSRTGQLVATFDHNPQLPFEDLRLSFFGGDRAALRMPSACGDYTTRTLMTSWSSAVPTESVSTFTIDRDCDNGSRFTPSLDAGVTNSVAGASSTFTLNLNRPDGQQDLSRLAVTLPRGQLAKLAGVPFCPEAAVPSGACGSPSQVGSGAVAVGAGTSPLNIPQPGRKPTAVFLGGPYKGAPYSLVTSVPAQAGPFDLGTVVVRTALNVDPQSTQVTAVSDALPQILQGIPISYRRINLTIDRVGFVRNPTSCAPATVGGTATSVLGVQAPLSSRYQLADCASLDFAPRLSLALRGETARGAYPALRAVLKAKKGEANISRVSVALPHSEFLAQEHIRTICTRVQFAADACPKGSIYGYAKATTPLLDQPLQGPVYLRSSSNPLPDLVAALHGQIDIDLVGRIDSVKGGIRTTFARVPDAPVSKFVLSMKGGRKGLLVNSRNLCQSTNRAKALVDGQNGKTADQSPVLSNGCRGKAKRGNAG